MSMLLTARHWIVESLNEKHHWFRHHWFAPDSLSQLHTLANLWQARINTCTWMVYLDWLARSCMCLSSIPLSMYQFLCRKQRQLAASTCFATSVCSNAWDLSTDRRFCYFDLMEFSRRYRYLKIRFLLRKPFNIIFQRL